MKYQSNTEFVLDLMRNSKSGPMMQAFVIEALSSYSRDQANAENWSDASLGKQASWKKCATECQEKLDEKYGQKVAK